MKIPSFDLTRQYQHLKPEILTEVERVMASGHYILGPEVQAFEDEAAKYLGVKHAIGVANGTDALWLALRALEIGAGDVVITTPFTFFATASAILNVGAKPLFVDIDEQTFNIDPKAIRKLLGSDMKLRGQAKAIIPVHLYGQPADMDEIVALADEFNLRVIEDAAQAIGSKYGEDMAGSIGDFGCISFFPTKNIGAFGDAGLVITQDSDLAERVQMLRVQGSKAKYHHDMIGMNSRMDALQAAILRVKLRHLDRWIKARQGHALAYDQLLRSLDGVIVPAQAAHRTHVYHQYTVCVLNGEREALQEYLQEKGIGSTVYYPLPLHLQPAIRSLGGKVGDFPITERVSREVLSLPIFPELTGEERRMVGYEIEEFCSKNRTKAA
ncbi:DegT/DnrJ/EryC1/StrS family aminotransferase [Candidatus Acetothermia bacterium]|nr:DegT/DnrJ/EryC1/StrS family aminotransferase [Candidatus Acetothermia bacterium]MBI3643992.1 DegT/DnrJ/EryC1/StrS family aminotransferase [Candidatus Acetothermia bacterium]